MSGSPATSERDALDLRRLRADRVVERQRAVEHAAGDLPALGHLAQRGGVDRRRHLRVDRLDRGEDRDLRPRRRRATRARSIAFWTDVDLVLERRRDVDRGVGDDQDLVIRRHVHDEDVADAAPGAQAGLLARRPRRAARRVCRLPFIRSSACALANQLDRLRRRRMAVRRVDDARCLPRSIPCFAATSWIFAAGPTRIGTIKPISRRLDRAGERRLLRTDARPRSATGSSAAAPLQQLVRTFRFRFVESCCSSRAPAPARAPPVPVSFRKKRQNDRQRRRRSSSG